MADLRIRQSAYAGGRTASVLFFIALTLCAGVLIAPVLGVLLVLPFLVFLALYIRQNWSDHRSSHKVLLGCALGLSAFALLIYGSLVMIFGWDAANYWYDIVQHREMTDFGCRVDPDPDAEYYCKQPERFR